MFEKNNPRNDVANSEREEIVYVPPLDNDKFEAEEVDEKHLENDKEECEEELILPPAPEESTPFYGEIAGLTYWGFSQQGESHIESNLPCQDRCRVVVSDAKHPVIIAAIADGVGSCALSHYGAAIATESATSFLKEIFDENDSDQFEDKWVGDTLRAAMHHALQSVKRASEEMEQLEYSFQSTLTIAIYNGDILYISHAGDDGIVALTEEGRVELVTSRIKGEEASSVYPLQAGPSYWQVLKVDRYVNGFVMATDGVLDAFVRGEKEENRIYYPFIQPAFEVRQKKVTQVKETMDFYYDYMSGQEYRSVVTDDLTIVVVTNQKSMNKKNMPVFDKEEWQVKTKEYKERVNAALYSDRIGEGENIQEDSIPEEKREKTAIDARCKNCGEKIVRGNKFCPNCGKPLVQQKGQVKTVEKLPKIKTPIGTQGRNSHKQTRKKDEDYCSKAKNTTKKVDNPNAKKKEYSIFSSQGDNSWEKAIITIMLISILAVILGGYVIGSLLIDLLF